MPVQTPAMIPYKIALILILVSYSITSCNEKQKNKVKSISPRLINLTTTNDSILSNDFSYYTDSIFHIQNELIKYLIKKYDNDSCLPLVYGRKNLKEEFEGFKQLGDINNDNKNDSVFVLDPLNWCEYDDGQSYYFTDTSLPRVVSGSYCSRPANFFKAPDIDEDGICEVGFFFSSCVSRYKSLRVYRLKNEQWEQIAIAEFDIMTQDPAKVELETLVQKISKNRFQIKNFFEGKRYWDTVLVN